MSLLECFWRPWHYASSSIIIIVNRVLVSELFYNLDSIIQLHGTLCVCFRHTVYILQLIEPWATLFSLQLSLSDSDDVTPVAFLSNTSSHLYGPSRTLGAVMCGYSGIRSFEPQVKRALRTSWLLDCFVIIIYAVFACEVVVFQWRMIDDT